MAEVAILIGLQASGKTTFYRRMLAATHEHVSKDMFPNARRPQLRQLRLITAALAAGRDVAVDNTNPSAAEWAPLIEVAHVNDARAVGYWFPVTSNCPEPATPLATTKHGCRTWASMPPSNAYAGQARPTASTRCTR